MKKKKKILWSPPITWKDFPGLHHQEEKKYFICDPGESRYEPGALMKRAEYPANTLTGPRWILGNKAKWLLSDLVCLSTAALHLWLWALLLWLQTTDSSVITWDEPELYILNLIRDFRPLKSVSLAPFSPSSRWTVQGALLTFAKGFLLPHLH